jgi:hypothetical protein
MIVGAKHAAPMPTVIRSIDDTHAAMRSVRRQEFLVAAAQLALEDCSQERMGR